MGRSAVRAIKWALGAALVLMAGPAYAEWTVETDVDTASAFVLADRGRRFALSCSRNEPTEYRLVLDMVAKPRLMQDPAPVGFTIAGRRYRYRGAMEELPGGLRRITTNPVAFGGRTELRMRRDLKRGIRVSVEDQSSYRLFGFNLRGSGAAVEGFERACMELWTTPRPDTAAVADTSPVTGTAPSDDAAVETAAAPAPAPETFEPAREDAWRLKLVDGQPMAFTEGLAGDRIGLACAAGGRTEWILDVVEGRQRPASALNVALRGPNASVSVAAIRAPTRERGLGSYRAAFDLARDRVILRDLGRGDGELAVLTDAGDTLAALPLEGAPTIVSRLLKACSARAR